RSFPVVPQLVPKRAGSEEKQERHYRTEGSWNVQATARGALGALQLPLGLDDKTELFQDFVSWPGLGWLDVRKHSQADAFVIEDRLMSWEGFVSGGLIFPRLIVFCPRL